ncbi:hypothetical protein [Rothia mucilaginosa]|uniref:hypothetical protein n=1 Tax=Rothia mucilaginosa TaxID=43675 RepID=UPI0028D72007|nr:hypothetical protein [Rothia mucilaginosa]
MTPSRFLSSTVPAAPSGLPASGLHRGAVRVRTRGVALVLSLAAALVVPLSGCATQNADSSASASASVDGSLAVSRGVAPVNEEREGYRLFSGRGPVEEAVFEGPAGTGSYSYIEFERRGEPTAPMRVSLRDEAGTSVEFPAGESGEMGGVWVRNTASPSASASAGASSDVSLSATRVTASTSNLADDAQWVVSVRSMGVDSSGGLTAPEGLALVSQTLSSGDIVQQGTRGFVDDTMNRSSSAAVENRSGAPIRVYCAGATRQELTVPSGGRVFLDDLGVRAADKSPLLCGVVASDASARWTLTTLGSRA